ncbi:DNA starvation/stationary phase protection protein [Thermasporomyces composti]|uniref:Starvation-inducible DNA-binding protein n=1 Tax=Thermasporomyces composti TaxID=696763 RepID=A0A3D9V7A3_THECX|nr:DNA starvation/stationary phase protection protein [Thermasporomyces composti]REF37678.1 starvation-inducible DNA-binding protein [Thermasporomyces composti]
MGAHRASPLGPGSKVARFLQPMLVDLLALVLNGRQALWHLRGHQRVRFRLELLVSDAWRFADEVAARMVSLGVPADGRPSTVTTTTSVPELVAGFLTEDKTVSAVVDQVEAVLARARDAVACLAEVDPVSRGVAVDLVRRLESHRVVLVGRQPL